jgi:membrane protease YdiL (CAAX protease family)
MYEIVNEIVSTILQVLVFSLVPFIAFLFRKNINVTFFRYIGLYRPTAQSVKFSIATSLLFIAAGIGMVFFDAGVHDIVVSPPSVTGKIKTADSAAVAILLICIIAMIKTSFAEEILFRGFIAKRLVALWGYWIGNLVQSLIFGLVHLALFWKLMNPSIFAVLFIFVLSTTAGWGIGFIKVKYANGSIVPGWIAHAIGNTVSYSIIVFFA